MAGGASWPPVMTVGREDEPSTNRDTVRGGGLAMGGAEDEEDVDDADDADEEDVEEGPWPDSVESGEDINHLGGRMACLGGGCSSFGRMRTGSGLGMGVKRTPVDPKEGQTSQTCTQTQTRTQKNTDMSNTQDKLGTQVHTAP